MGSAQNVYVVPNGFTQSTPAAYVSDVDDGQPQRVTKDSQVRLRIVSARFDNSEIFAIGALNQEYLGLIQE